ncbi:hypothetical protein [Hymenobacter coalescens]
MEVSSGKKWARIFGLPAVLMGLQGLMGGFHYESNDDLIIDLLLRGISGPEPVANLHLYLHGWSQLLAALYMALPAVSWYALMLYGLLYLALVNSFYVLEELSNERLRPLELLLVEVAFWAATYFLHAVQINFTRPAILLGAAAGLLLFAPRAGGRRASTTTYVWAGLALAAAWGVRPAAAELGLGLTLPLVLWQGRRRGTQTVAFAGVLLLTLTGLQRLTAPPTADYYRQMDLERAHLFDYRTTELSVHNAQDSLAYQSLIPHQGINDTLLLNQSFFQRCARPVASPLDVESYSDSLVTAVGSLLLRLNPCLLAVLGCWLAVGQALRRGRLQWRSWPVLVFWTYQVGFAGLFLLLVPHLPLRVLQSIVTVYTLVNLVLAFGLLLPEFTWPRLRPVQRHWALGSALAVLALWLGVNGQLWQRLNRNKQLHSEYLQALRAEAGRGVVVEQGLHGAFVHLSPFASYELLAFYKIMSLTGWNAFDPSQPRLRQVLTGTRDLPLTLQQLNQRPSTTWLLLPDFAPFLEHYLNHRLALPPGQRLRLEPAADSRLLTAANLPRRYYLRSENTAPTSITLR